MPGKTEKGLYMESGVTGLTRFGGTISEEWLRELRGSRGAKIYKEMRDNDSVIGAFLYAVKMLLRQVNWHVEAGGETAEDELAASFVTECFDDLQGTWQELLSEILSMLPFGWALLEVVYKKRTGPTRSIKTSSKYSDGRIGWRKWSLRAQETLSEWVFDDDNEVTAMIQLPPPDYAFRTIPMEKALLFQPEVTKGNPEGRSMLRNAYRSWYMKKNIEDVEAIGIERDLAGLPVVWLPEFIINKSDADAVTAYNAWKTLITNVRRDEQEGVMMPLVYDDNGNKMYDITLLSTGSRRMFDTSSVISRYDQRIAMTVMADFLLLGSGKVGSFALSSDKTDLFSVALGAILDVIQEQINHVAIPRLFDLNDFGTLTDLPKYIHEDVESPDLVALGDYIQKLSGAQMPLFPDDELENYLRSAAHLPAKPESLEAPAAIETGEEEPEQEPDQALAEIEKRYYDERSQFLDAVVALQKSVKETLVHGAGD